MDYLLEVRNLKVYFRTEAGVVKAVDGISYHLNESEVVGLVGESGCGKSVSQLAVLRLINPPGEIVDGKIIFEGRDLTKCDPRGPEMQSIRGAKIAMVFQEPMTSLNPALTVGRQITEMLQLHLGLDKRSAKRRAIELLETVGIPDSVRRIDDYPHQFSGGMRQRVMIAMALSCRPKIVIADEPTTALDVTTQAQILELLVDMVTQMKTSLVIVTHNFGLVARYAQRIYVMYAGRIIESGTTKEVFANPLHPYTRGLLKCIPRLDKENNRLEPIPGLPPNLINMPPVCAFYPRCSLRMDKCLSSFAPELIRVTDTHFVACHAIRE